MLRWRVVAIAIAMFVAVWAAIFTQLVSGHDPALARGATKLVPVAATSRHRLSTGTGATTSSSGSGATAVTTGQS